MAPAYKLTYFQARGVSESIRFLFKYGDIEFEDVRIKREDWPELKPKTPFGQVPFLEHNGKLVGQSVAIARYVGKLVNLGGNNDWENLEIDAIVDTLNDFKQKWATFHFEADEDKKNKLRETFLNETLPYYLSRLDSIVEKNGGFLALGRLTWADFYLASTTTSYNKFLGGDAQDVYAKYPNLKALSDKIYALPAIKKWVSERPETEM